MDTVGAIIAIIGALTVAVSGIWLIICAFQKSIVWGLLYMFIPFAALVYCVMDWQRAQKPFLIGVVGTIVIMAGFAMSPTARAGAVAARSASPTSSVPLHP